MDIIYLRDLRDEGEHREQGSRRESPNGAYLVSLGLARPADETDAAAAEPEPVMEAEAEAAPPKKGKADV